MSPLIALDRVGCAYDGVPVLESVDLEIGDGAFVGVVGPSGAGKTTLLRLLLGSLDPTAGLVRRRPGLKVGYVPQVETVNWDFPVTVDECVLMAGLGRRLLPWASRAERAAVAQVLERLGIGDLGDRHIRALSGGQQQRVFVARALFRRPELLLMDEPTSGVDLKTRHEVLHLLGELNGDGLAIVLTTHDLNGLAAHLPQLICLNGGVVGMGPREVLTPEVLEQTYGARLDVLTHGGMLVVVDRPVGSGAQEPQLGRVPT